MRVLVTGGAGFVGSHVVAEALAAGFEVAVLDNLSSGKRDAVSSGLKTNNARVLKSIQSTKIDGLH